jgi:hypothetical protein
MCASVIDIEHEDTATHVCVRLRASVCLCVCVCVCVCVYAHLRAGREIRIQRHLVTSTRVCVDAEEACARLELVCCHS